MRWLFLIVGTAALMALGLNLFPTAVFTARAYASKMDGKPFGAQSPKNLCFPAKCKGGGGGMQKTCSAYEQACFSRTGNVSGCQAAHKGCMQTGTWRGPMGGVFSGIARQ
jgi:hypothetical protein